jgi:hypothetical protein
MQTGGLLALKIFLKCLMNIRRTVGPRTGTPARTTAAWLLLAAPAGLGLMTLATPAAQAQNAAKSVQGKVFSSSEQALSGAIVYLQNNNTNVIKTFVTTADGSYRFGQLPADSDYKIWARYKNQESKSRVISSFDSKLNLTMDFHIGK